MNETAYTDEQLIGYILKMNDVLFKAEGIRDYNQAEVLREKIAHAGVLLSRHAVCGDSQMVRDALKKYTVQSSRANLAELASRAISYATLKKMEGSPQP